MTSRKRDNINHSVAFNISWPLPTDYMSKTKGNQDRFDDNYLQKSIMSGDFQQQIRLVTTDNVGA
jgi:hypothetical protein